MKNKMHNCMRKWAAMLSGFTLLAGLNMPAHAETHKHPTHLGSEYEQGTLPSTIKKKNRT